MASGEGYELDRLSLTVDEESEAVIDIIAVPDNPNIVGFDAPLGSLGLSSSGKAYRKVGNLDLDWQIGASVPDLQTIILKVPFCLSNGDAANIDLVAGEVPFRLSNGTFNNIELVN